MFYFAAEAGFTQGAPESPFLWVMYYDMVLTALQVSGVGSSVKLGTHGFASVGAGLIALADDTTILKHTPQATQRSMNVLARILRLSMLQVAPEKSIHTAVQWTETRGTPQKWLEEELTKLGSPFRVKLEGRVIPYQDHDESLRHLGYWVAVDGSDKEQRKKTT
jgi:hypothetical protein